MCEAARTTPLLSPLLKMSVSLAPGRRTAYGWRRVSLSRLPSGQLSPPSPSDREVGRGGGGGSRGEEREGGRNLLECVFGEG